MAAPRSPATGSIPRAAGSAWSLQVLELKGGQIVTIHNYLNTEILAEFGLPPRLDT